MEMNFIYNYNINKLIWGENDYEINEKAKTLD